MDKQTIISKIQNDLSAYQTYIESNFDESNHNAIDSSTLYSFGQQTYYVLSSIVESLDKVL